jgi:hypothetical protein
MNLIFLLIPVTFLPRQVAFWPFRSYLHHCRICCFFILAMIITYSCFYFFIFFFFFHIYFHFRDFFREFFQMFKVYILIQLHITLLIRDYIRLDDQTEISSKRCFTIWSLSNIMVVQFLLVYFAHRRNLLIFSFYKICDSLWVQNYLIFERRFVEAVLIFLLFAISFIHKRGLKECRFYQAKKIS